MWVGVECLLYLAVKSSLWVGVRGNDAALWCRSICISFCDSHLYTVVLDSEAEAALLELVPPIVATAASKTARGHLSLFFNIHGNTSLFSVLFSAAVLVIFLQLGQYLPDINCVWNKV